MSWKETIIRYALLAPVPLAPLHPYTQVVVFCVLFATYAVIDQIRWLAKQIEEDEC